MPRANSDTEDSYPSEVPKEEKDSFTNFLKTVASFTGDLSALTCPAYLLSPISLLEYCSYWCVHPELFAAISKPSDPEGRMLAVIRWYLSYLYGAYGPSRISKEKGEWEKKPYNPVLGELFLARWPANHSQGYSDTRMVAEQVSHHPPISGFFCESRSAGVILNGHNGQKTKFSGTSIYLDQIGHAVLHLTNFDNEAYLITLPSVVVLGLWYGSPYAELSGTSFIQSSTGFLAEFEYTGKGWLGGGEKHHIKCVLTKPGQDSYDKVTIEGQWSSQTFLKTNDSESKELFYDAIGTPATHPEVPTEKEGHPLESRRLWRKVSEALIAHDYSTASAEKSRIENSQRAERKERAENGIQWLPQYFNLVDPDPLYDGLEEVILRNSKGRARHADLGRASWIFKELLKE